MSQRPFHNSIPFIDSENKENLSLQNKNMLSNLNDSDSEDDSSPELSQLIRLIECPVCKQVPTPPIYNCVNGHFVCGSCRPKLIPQRCAYCLGSFTRVRNYPLECLVSTPSVHCDFIKFGCRNGSNLSLLEYENHVQSCWAQIW
jgi:E3 ubiquitin-protein ligase SIAH1